MSDDKIKTIIMDKLGVEPKNCIIVENSRIGVTSANASGSYSHAEGYSTVA